MIKIDMLRYFAVVAQSGNLADAAEKLGRTSSAISMVLKQFEEHLGAPLFESERKNRLTPLGEFTLQRALWELTHYDQTIRSIESYARAHEGLVRVAAIPSVASSILPEALRRFLAIHERVKVHIRDVDSPTILLNLALEETDLGYATLEQGMAGLKSSVLFSDAFGVLCRADHPIALLDRPVEWSDVAQYRFIENGTCHQIRTPQFRPILENPQLVIVNTTSILAAVRAGVGITVFPRLVVHDIHSDLRFVSINDLSARRLVHSVRRATSELSPAAEAFHRFVEQVSAEVFDTL